MTAQENRPSLWATLPVSLRAIIVGIVIALVPANVWPPLLLSVGVPVATNVEVVFLALYIWWVINSAVVWAFPLIVIYLLGLGAAWVRAGFRAKNQDEQYS